MKKLLFIYNYNAGMGQLLPVLPEVIDIFTEDGFLVTAYPTQAAKDAITITLMYGEEYDYVVCAGGDGTLNEVVDAIMLLDKKPKIGYIPCGSTNDFACNVGLPLYITEAAELVASGTPTLVDIGGITSEGEREFFSYVAAFGLFTDVAYSTPQGLKNALGHLAYIMEGVKRLGNINTFWCRVEVDGEIIEDDFIFGMVTNSSSVGGFSLRKTTEECDENERRQFQLIMLRKISSLQDLGQVIATLMDSNPPNEEMFVIKTIGGAKFTFENGVDWTLDGEFGGNHKEVQVDINKKAVELILP